MVFVLYSLIRSKQPASPTSFNSYRRLKVIFQMWEYSTSWKSFQSCWFYPLGCTKVVKIRKNLPISVSFLDFPAPLLTLPFFSFPILLGIIYKASRSCWKEKTETAWDRQQLPSEAACSLSTKLQLLALLSSKGLFLWVSVLAWTQSWPKWSSERGFAPPLSCSFW